MQEDRSNKITVGYISNYPNSIIIQIIYLLFIYLLTHIIHSQMCHCKPLGHIGSVQRAEWNQKCTEGRAESGLSRRWSRIRHVWKVEWNQECLESRAESGVYGKWSGTRSVQKAEWNQKCKETLDRQAKCTCLPTFTLRANLYSQQNLY
jgi:hypothetical protein